MANEMTREKEICFETLDLLAYEGGFSLSQVDKENMWKVIKASQRHEKLFPGVKSRIALKRMEREYRKKFLKLMGVLDMYDDAPEEIDWKEEWGEEVTGTEAERIIVDNIVDEGENLVPSVSFETNTLVSEAEHKLLEGIKKGGPYYIGVHSETKPTLENELTKYFKIPERIKVEEADMYIEENKLFFKRRIFFSSANRSVRIKSLGFWDKPEGGNLILSL